MRKILIITSLVVFVSAVFVEAPSLQAQTSSPAPSATEEPFTFSRAYKDYVFTYDVYKKSHSDYLLAKAQYEAAKTLASQTKVRDATVVLLQSRDDVVVTYLTALRLKLAESEGISETDRDGLYTRLDSEVAWFQNHKASIPSAGTLADLTTDSKEASDHFVTTTPLIYELLATIPFGKVDTIRMSATQVLSQTKTKVSEIRANGDHDTTVTERWILETENKLTRSLDKEIEAQTMIASLPIKSKTGQKENKEQSYNEVIAKLTESLQFLKEASNFMREILKQIKTAQ